jgi:NADPH:quinone reductase-like Zn-dependent oxidoreductase
MTPRPPPSSSRIRPGGSGCTGARGSAAGETLLVQAAAIVECHRQLTKLVADGAIRPLVSERLGQQELPAALQRLAEGDTIGRIVVTP